MDWYWVLFIILGSFTGLLFLSIVLYKSFFKRFYDIFFSGLALIILSPIMFIMIIVGAIVMKGNPFFVQKRPGKQERIFNLIKFRSMTCEKDKNAKLLTDDERLTRYGKFIRKTSLDELPELFNIFAGNMSIIGPRPLLVKYLPYYTDEERKRHEVRPGLTGYAQTHGRNNIIWEEKFKDDLFYVKNLSLKLDFSIILSTIRVVLTHSDIVINAIPDFDEYRKEQNGN